jgi:murein L,D-transpeptidase YafK
LKAYPVALGSQSGRKQCEGDHRTPEGMYVVDSRNERSAFHRALHLSYPNATDLKAARKAGCSPGGAIMIHGAKNGFEWLGRLHRLKDWTTGCVAVTNAEVDEIWNAVPNGATVEIRP